MTNMQEMLGSMGEGEEGIATNVDIVFVIDATRSMRTTIDMVKESALSFQDKLYDFMDEAKSCLLYTSRRAIPSISLQRTACRIPPRTAAVITVRHSRCWSSS